MLAYGLPRTLQRVIVLLVDHEPEDLLLRDIRLLLLLLGWRGSSPGHGDKCWLRVAATAAEEWRTGALRTDWEEERGGSERSLVNVRDAAAATAGNCLTA